MKKRSLFKAVSALTMAVVMTIGVSTTAFAALNVTLDVKAPDGSAVATEVIDGKTVYLVPHDSTYTITGTNGVYLGQQLNIDFKNPVNVNGDIIRSYGVGTADALPNQRYNIDTILNEYPGVSVYRPEQKEKNFGNEWAGEANNGRIDIKNLPDYSYIVLDLYDQDWSENSGGTVTYYFKFVDGTSTSAVTSSWASDSTGWWIQNSDGSYLTNAWYQDTDGKWYYMGADGYMLTNTTTPDGFYVNADGVWVQ